MERYIPVAQTRLKGTARLVIVLVNKDTKERYWGQQFCQMERDISVRPTEMTRPVGVDQLQSWSRIYQSDQTKMVRSIWFYQPKFSEWKAPPDSKGPRSRFRIFPDRESRITLHGAKEPSNTIHYPSLGMLMKGSKSNHIPGAHNPELATPMLGLCHGVFTDQFIFRHIVGHFFGENRTSTMSMSAFEVWRIKKENQMLLKGKNIIFRSVGFCWLVCGI